MNILWLPGLKDMWEQSWFRTMERQRYWEDKVLLKIGAPVAEDPTGSPKVDLIEYMVLREARDSLPTVKEPQDAP